MTVSEVAAADLAQRPELDFPWRADIMAVYPAIDYAVDEAGARLVTQSMVAAIIDRETNFRNIFQAGVSRGPGCGVGLCQITAGVDWTDPAHPKAFGLDMTVPQNNVLVAVRNYLVPAIRAFPGSHQEAFDAYNLGIGGVQAELASGQSPDALTTGGNYGRSVLQSWITYAAILLNTQVDWSSWKPL